MATFNPIIYSWGDRKIFDDNLDWRVDQWLPYRNQLMFTLYMFGLRPSDDLIFFEDKIAIVRDGEEIAATCMRWMAYTPTFTIGPWEGMEV